MSRYLIDRNDAVGVMIDMQEKLMVAMHDTDHVADCAARMVKGLRVLGVPVITVQQYTKGLGETVPVIREALGDDGHVEKNTFCAAKNDDFCKALKDSGKKTVLIWGTETHICVQQTALTLLEQGYQVFLIADACGSRTPVDKDFACRRMAHAGVIVTTYESALFELIEGSKSEGFKEISAIVK